MKQVDNYFQSLPEPQKSCLLAVHSIIMSQDPHITAEWKYAIPMYCYKGKMFCYIRADVKTLTPYIGMVEGNRLDYPGLVQGNRSRMKVMNFDPEADLPIEILQDMLNEALDFYRKGIIPIKKK
ncbi:DUF1801 domain-containing protein [Chitinophaga caseinilytica]|uniref:DUF1801 domain-containing protein n=1 Tax=Chitinophaga caseinilytica TaxID=2267521 RepID=UPI003C2BA681